VLTATAKRLTKALRTCDTAARLGGDEFVVILEGIHSADEVAQISRKIQRAILQPILLENWTQVKVSASIGMAMYPDNGRSLAALLQAADKAMYECKTSRPMELA
jgi:diguanylate cyclase (GGDEF)-like protein